MIGHSRRADTRRGEQSKSSSGSFTPTAADRASRGDDPHQFETADPSQAPQGQRESSLVTAVVESRAPTTGDCEGSCRSKHSDEKKSQPPPNMENPPLASISLTHVQYDPTSHLSHASAYLALVPQVLMISYVTLIWATREVEIAVMFAGQLACEALNWILKRYIREERPTQMLGKGYGMPSSHAQFVAFFAIYLSLWMLVRHDPWKHNESKTHIPTPMWQRIGLSIAAMAGALAVAQSRVYLKYHHPRQVYVGFAAGAACAVAWFVVTSLGRHFGLIEFLLELPPMKWLRMRDLLVNEDMVDAGWERWELRKRQLKAMKHK